MGGLKYFFPDRPFVFERIEELTQYSTYFSEKMPFLILMIRRILISGKITKLTQFTPWKLTAKLEENVADMNNNLTSVIFTPYLFFFSHLSIVYCFYSFNLYISPSSSICS